MHKATDGRLYWSDADAKANGWEALPEPTIVEMSNGCFPIYRLLQLARKYNVAVGRVRALRFADGEWHMYQVPGNETYTETPMLPNFKTRGHHEP